MGRVMRYALTLAGIGIAIGAGGGLMAGRVLASFLYRVSATDPLTYLGVIVVLVAVAAIASFLPAHRASRIDPMVAIRME